MKVKINLMKLIKQAAPQVWGSDERNLLYDFIARNTEPEQIVTVDIVEALEVWEVKHGETTEEDRSA